MPCARAAYGARTITEPPRRSLARGNWIAANKIMRRFLIVGFAILIACKKEPPTPPAGTAPPAPVAPTRSAAGDSDVRVMLAELASSKACAMIRGRFQGLRAPDHLERVTGVLWTRECKISNVGLHVTFQISGNGWSWVDQTSSKAGGTFSVRQYVRFSMATTIRGALDIGYDRDAHLATVWFTPDSPPDVDFKTIGDISVDRQGVWSSVVGALGETFATSPGDVAVEEATAQGTRSLGAQLAKGFAVTINLCSGLTRVSIGHPAKGKMPIADVGETRGVPVELQPGGVMIIGPQIADHGMSLDADALQGAVRLTLVCAKDAEKVASEYIAGRITSTIPVLGAVDVRTEAKLLIKPTSCPVVVVVSPLDNSPARFAWERPTAEIARSTGGSLISCKKPEAARP